MANGIGRGRIDLGGWGRPERACGTDPMDRRRAAGSGDRCHARRPAASADRCATLRRLFWTRPPWPGMPAPTGRR